MRGTTRIFPFLLAVSCGATLPAQLRLAPLFTDHMVLQRGQPVPVWGTAQPGQAIEVRFGKQTQTARTDGRGRWMVRLAPLSAGDGDTLTVRGRYTITCSNVLIGEVWICSGQSNMDWRVSQTTTTARDIATARFPEIRLFSVQRAVADRPQDWCQGSWQTCSPQTVKGFSAVGYLFGRRLHKDLKVPIGLIKTAWGGTRAEAWTSPAGMTDPQLRPIVEHWNLADAAFPKKLARHKTQLAGWTEASAKAKREKKKPPRKPRRPGDPRRNPHRHSGLYNAMVAPLVPFAIRGAIWYQGESNVPRAFQYRRLFATMIRDWRNQWQQGEFPFLFVQLAAYRYGHDPRALPELWEAQVQATRLPNVGMASAVDSQSPTDIHPRNKLMVALRLARCAKAIAYDQKIVHSGPSYKSCEIDGDRIRVAFDHLGGGLKIRGETLTGFTVCGADKKFHPARAVLAGDAVVVSNPKVKKPVAVRYAWHQTPELSLYNTAGLPASPFRTDTFPAVTKGKVKP